MPASLELVKSGPPRDTPPGSPTLFVGFSYADLPPGKSFDVVFPNARAASNKGMHPTADTKVVIVSGGVGRPET